MDHVKSDKQLFFPDQKKKFSKSQKNKYLNTFNFNSQVLTTTTTAITMSRKKERLQEITTIRKLNKFEAVVALLNCTMYSIRTPRIGL